LYETRRVGLDYYCFYFGILFAIAIFSLPLTTTLLNAHQHQAMAQTQNATNNNTDVSSARAHNLPASPSTPNVPNGSKAATAAPNPIRPTATRTPPRALPTVLNITLPINLTKPINVKFKSSLPYENDNLTFYITQKPANGHLSNVANNSVTYTPNATLAQDKFTYRATDKVFHLPSNIGTVTLDHPPAVSNMKRSINGTKPVKVQLAGSDLDKGDKLTFSLVQKPLNAQLSDPSGNLSTYAPNPGFIGQDKFTYRAKDSAGLSSNNGTVTINVGKPLPTTSANATGTAPIPTGFFVPLLSTVLIYAVIVSGFMILPLVYDMRKTYNQNAKPSTEASKKAGFPDLARSLMAFGIIIILAILVFHVLVTVTYNVVPLTTNKDLVDVIKNLSTVLGGAVSAIIGFYFGQRSIEKNGTTGGGGAPIGGGTVGGGPTVVSTVPSDGSNPVPRDSKIAATFSETVLVEANSFTLKDIKNNPIEGTTSLSQDGKTLEFKPSTKLDPSTTYSATITGVKHLAGDTISSPKTWKFTTAPATV
jgi:cytoskeletal protein RodZ